ncbi:MAG: 3-hydroxybutyryl-CoA dehydrogenase [Deltaproteobacteria bacterium]|nr:3-hydroxybutyryl-CoA dehydrogenase [Deltaproteobacteria bacterium]
MNAKSIGVVGTGVMGSGIAQVIAQSGIEVLWLSRDAGRAKAAVERIAQSLGRVVAKAKMTEAERDAAIGRLHTTTSFDDLARVDLVIESVPEDLAAKIDVFRRVEAAVGASVILASNSSSLSITKIGASTKRPERVVGMHFMNPAPLMKLVEVVRGLATSDDVIKDVSDVARALGKTIVVAKDRPGFVVNRVLIPMINEAVFTFMEGVAGAEEIDTAMKLGCNQPMGPLELADLIGLDVCLSIMERLHAASGESKYRPCPLMRDYVDAGWLGRKVGRGFYVYEKK